VKQFILMLMFSGKATDVSSIDLYVITKKILMLRLVKLSLLFKVVKYQECVTFPGRCLIDNSFHFV
jgi:hypothetical protein